MTTEMLQTPGQKPASRKMLYIPFILLGLVALVWSAIWFYGRYRINQELDTFFVKQAAEGRQWSCPDRSISGFPFRVEGRCTKPTYNQELSPGDKVSGALGALTVVASTAGAFNLAHVISEFEGPLTISRDGVGESTATWKTARTSVRGGIARLEQVSLEMESPVFTVAPKGGTPLKWSASKLTAHLREGVNPQQPGAYDLAINLERAILPELDTLVNNNDPLSLELDAKVLKPGTIDRKDWRASVENWRVNGGTLKVEQLKLTKGAPRVEAKGDLKLDDMRRVEGRLDASFVNADALLRQFGIGGGGGAAGGLLGALLGGGRPNPNEAQRERSMRLPLVFDQGRVAVGPFRIPGVQLKPVY
jgi:hypothetical protein